MPDARIDCDVLIVGGGLVGSLLANALSGLPLRVVLVEARSVESLEQPSFDGRATALANGSQRVLEQLGLWESIRGEAQPIRHIHIGERGRFGAARIDAREEGVSALGYTVENRKLGAALWQALAQQPGFSRVSPAEVKGFDCRPGAIEARIDSGSARSRITARLMVAADGAQSKLRHALGIAARIDDYGQHAIVVNCTTDEPHRARAFERFTPDGPLAVLPLTRDRVAVVWTLPTRPARSRSAMPASSAGRILELADDDFRSALQSAFGYRLGHFRRVGRRDMYPLQRVQSNDVIRERTVLVGNAAIALHPVAGQGFNLALRDASALAELIAEKALAGSSDVGSADLLERYRRWRSDDQRKLARFTHALIRGFGAQAPGLDALRGAGLMAFDLIPGAKSVLARHTMGLAGRVPKLARKLSIVG
ncbi:MAG TPA: 2-octaprenyl-6-methoxyphenyl hydroxylase [Gammaproteobacteria bacterium]|nr:2-octaprenyl-6-methoxyphenyl hydroxylase [Gammaproteobacteria bacterium]